MTVLTAAALSAYLTAHDCVPRDLVPVMTAIAMHESGGDTEAVHRNPNGTVDIGIAQVNSSNFGWLGLTMQSAMDPCTNVRAGARVLLARYNGTPPDTVKAAYSADVLARMMAQSAPAETTVPGGEPDCPKQPDDGWHTIAIPPRCVAAEDNAPSSTSKEPTEDANSADRQ